MQRYLKFIAEIYSRFLAENNQIQNIKFYILALIR